MNKRVLHPVALIIGLAVSGAAASSDDRGLNLSEAVAKRTDRILLRINEDLSQRIVRETTQPLAQWAEREQAVMVPVAVSTGRTRRSVSLER